jgi:hypothetical protein
VPAGLMADHRDRVEALILKLLAKRTLGIL